jgi:putative DNA primase/helicase
MADETPPASAQEIAEKVQRRAAELLAQAAEARKPLDPRHVKQCLDTNERGDGCMFASIHRSDYLYNTTPKDGEWYLWAGNVWERDEFRRVQAAVEDCALEYQGAAETLKDEIETEEITDKKHWKHKLRDKYKARADRLRSANGVAKALHWAPVVEPAMACRESDFDNEPWLLPVKNGVVNLKTGVLTSGRPEDMLTRTIDVEYDPHADYTEFAEFVREVADSDDVAAFLKRSFGYAITGHSFEQFIWVFTGPGRNGKGVLFSTIGDVLGPYYHEISRAMLVEQRNEQSPAAASEHKYSLLGKRIIVGAETNKGQKIDASAIKSLTGEDRIVCRPLFKSEIQFKPTHTLFLHTNHIPHGLTRDFALVQRLLKIDFPFMYVDDPEAEGKKYPAQADMFRKKDPMLKDRLRKIKQGVLRWLVEGCLEWQQIGLSPPACIVAGIDALAREEDYIGQFMTDCLIPHPDNDSAKVSCTRLHEVFQWWWSQNMDIKESRVPGIKAINTAIRERGHLVDKTGGKTWLYRHIVNGEIEGDVDDFLKKKRG